MDQLHGTLDQVFKLLKDPVGNVVHDSIKAIKVGLANESYIMTTEGGERYVARVLRAQTDESARAEALIQHALLRAGIRSPQYLEFNDGDVVAHVDGKRIAISRFIEGNPQKVQDVTLTRNLGAMLARIHDALADISPDLIPESSAQAFRVESITDGIASLPEGEVAANLVERFQKLKEFPDRDLPRSIIHGDLFGMNVFTEDGDITAVFDFETAQYTVRVLDLARTHLENLEEKFLEPRASKEALFEGYDSVARLPLTDAEKAAFDDAVKYVAIANSTWLYSNNQEDLARRVLNSVDF